MENYLNENLTYTEFSLVDPNGGRIMMDWETDIMGESASIVCSKGGNVLNIGFGMGVIDSFIQQKGIISHTIIECHKDVISKMESDGWFNKNNVTIIHDLWENVIDELPEFSGVYYDTWRSNDLEFMGNVHKIVKKGGIFSFFNTQFYSPNTCSLPKGFYDILKENFDIKSIQIPISYDSYNIEGIEKYWNIRRKKYWIPVCIKK